MIIDQVTNEFLAGLTESVNVEFNPITYLAIDPGKSNGICGYDAKCYQNIQLGIQAEDLLLVLNCFKKVEICIVEDFKLYPNKAAKQHYSNMETSRVIGRIEAWAESHSVKLVKQPATIKETGYKWLGKKPLPKSNPMNHELDAHIHFMYWAIRHKVVKIENLGIIT